MTCRPSEACSPASAASTSGWSEPDGRPAGKSSGTPTASTSLPTTGPMFPDMETSAPSTGRRPVLWSSPDANEWKNRSYSTQQYLEDQVMQRPHKPVPAPDALSPSISSPAGSPASRGAWPGSDGEPRTIVGSGPSSSEPFASYDPGTSSWRTSQGSWLAEEAWGLSSEDWPRSGMTRSGMSYRQRPSAPRTSVSGSGSSLTGRETHHVPTPTASDHIDRVSTSSETLNFETNKSVDLVDWVRRWPTPTVDDSSNVTRKSGQYQSLTRAVMYPTPSAEDNRDRGNLSMPSIQRRAAIGKQLNLSMVVDPNSGALNPTWVELLMGFPPGWTDIESEW